MDLPKHDCGLYLTHNEHKDSYESVKSKLEKITWLNNDKNWATPTSKKRAIETDELWQLQWYPKTPVGFHIVLGATLEEVLERANEYRY